jgi:aminopeptidase N
LRTRMLQKNNWGIAANDAGPLWLGLRLSAPRTEGGYQNVTYPKGAFVLSMLRSIMRADGAARANPDQAFIDMMHDFVSSHADKPASTESFKAVAEKHMTKEMDLLQNGRLDWFFREWVYGTEVPRYQYKYEIEPGPNHSAKVRVEITQSEVGPNFQMLLPVYADFGKGMIRVGQVPVAGSSTRTAVFNMDSQPKKVAVNFFKDVLER